MISDGTIKDRTNSYSPCIEFKAKTENHVWALESDGPDSELSNIEKNEENGTYTCTNQTEHLNNE